MLEELDFKDIYLSSNQAWLSGVPGTKDPVVAPVAASEELAELRALCGKRGQTTKNDEFAVRSNGISYRVSYLKSVNEDIFVLRRMPASIPTPEELSIHPSYVEMLVRKELSGLVVFAGTFGQGKTTSVSAVVVERLKRHGGVAMTIEDPPEMPLEGTHGEGVCFQTWEEHGDFGEACRKMLRRSPSIIFIGEVRDPETAAEALRASANGRLVVCTVHGESVPMAVERLYSLANSAIGNPDDTSSMLANGLAAVMHQRLEGTPRKPKLEFLWLADPDSHGVRTTLRQRKWEQIANEVQMQRNRLFVQRRPASATASDTDARIALRG
ncbi:MAG: GspE family protein [Hydrogenophaga sp.]|jgi:Tfp pilus assembly pilus retraction ATPase PilT|uniref:ATPase, T2SS/T4P/T4SS family n=1 Tax=Hydrogenophaga sp. TaxID=1904254 RepID=UPI002630E812|nr:ATPase, T2SS/T4P/T4SS family [Hydrogenophaga sp.]MCV0438988.1 GspE family protein [Hydrogenophaga sp.]